MRPQSTLLRSSVEDGETSSQLNDNSLQEEAPKSAAKPVKCPNCDLCDGSGRYVVFCSRCDLDFITVTTDVQSVLVSIFTHII